MHLTVVSAYN